MTAAGTTEVIYVTKERVRIILEHGLDYLVEDLDTGKRYLIDQSYLRRKYSVEGEVIPIHTEVWNKLENQALQLHQLKRANSRLKNEVRELRRQAEEARKGKTERHHYRNGQKRGRTRNG